MNIEVKKTIEIEMVLQGLRNEIKHGCKETNKEMLEDAIQVIEVLSKKNKQLRDINKNLNEKLEKRKEVISDLTSQVDELNNLMFEMKNEEKECKCCCCEPEVPSQTNPIPIEIQKLKSLQDEVPTLVVLGIL